MLSFLQKKKVACLLKTRVILIKRNIPFYQKNEFISCYENKITFTVSFSIISLRMLYVRRIKLVISITEKGKNSSICL